MFHNRHTISIGQLAVLMDSKDLSLVINRQSKDYKLFRWFLTKKAITKAFNKLINEVNEVLNKSALQKEIELGIFKIKLYNKAFNLYPSLVNLTKITWDKKHMDLIEEITGYRLEKLEDRKIIIDETERLQGKFREFLNEKKPEGVSFYEIIISVESILGHNIDRAIKLFEFQGYIKQASEKIKIWEKNK
jgi:hypothetical protein